MPGLALVLLGADLAYSGNNVDPFIYVGTVERLGDFLVRWPETYFPYRFGYILPEWAAESVLGPTTGYLVARFALLGMVSLTLWRWSDCRRWLVPAGVAGVLFATSPVVVRAAFSTYPESFAALFLVIGVGVLIPISVEHGVGRRRAFVAGLLFGLSSNSYAFAMAVCLVVVGVVFAHWFVATRGREFVMQLGCAFVLFGGMALVGLAGTLAYGLRFGVWDVFSSTLAKAGEDTNEVFIEHVSTWFTWRHYLFVVPLALIMTAVVVRRTSDPRIRRGLRRLAFVVGALLSLFVGMQWIQGTSVLSTPYASSYLLVVVWLLIARNVSIVLSLFDRRQQVLLVPAFLVVTLGAYFIGANLKVDFVGVAIIVLVGAIVGGGALSVRRAGVWVGAVAAIFAMATYLTVSSPHHFPPTSPGFRIDPAYDSALLYYDNSGFDVYRLAREYARFVPAWPSERGGLRVWFRQGRWPVDQVQSTLGWLLSALQTSPDGSLPNLTALDLATLDQLRPRWLVVLDGDPYVVDSGLAALKKAGAPYSVTRRKTIGSGDLSVNVAVLERG